jgi:hypothetical protein
MAQPENLNLWDRLFNRYRKTVLRRHNVISQTHDGRYKQEYPYVEYTVTDRLTGSETIERQWLNGRPVDIFFR